MTQKKTSPDDPYLNSMMEAVAANASTTGDKLSQLSQLAERQLEAEKRVAEKERELEEAKSHLRDLAEVQIPELMDGAGVLEYRTTTGLFISIKETIRASVTEEKKPEAFAWLRNNGHGALISRVVSVSFGRGEDTKAEELVEELGVKGLSPESKTSVNANTLSAFVREQLREGLDIPVELFGVHRQRVAKVDVPKVPRQKGKSVRFGDL